MSPRSTTRPLYCWCFCLQFGIPSNDRCPSARQNELLRPSSLLHRSLLICFWLSSGPTPESIPVSPHSLSTAAFAAGIFMAWSIGINLCTKLSCCSELSPFPALWSSWWVGNDSPQTQSCGFTGFQNTRKFWFDLIGFTTGRTMLTVLACLARHGGSHWRFQFLASILDVFFEFLVLRSMK